MLTQANGTASSEVRASEMSQPGCRGARRFKRERSGASRRSGEQRSEPAGVQGTPPFQENTARERGERATRSERAGGAASESACRGVRGAKPLERNWRRRDLQTVGSSLKTWRDLALFLVKLLIERIFDVFIDSPGFLSATPESTQLAEALWRRRERSRRLPYGAGVSPPRPNEACGRSRSHQTLYKDLYNDPCPISRSPGSGRPAGISGRFRRMPAGDVAFS